MYVDRKSMEEILSWYVMWQTCILETDQTEFRILLPEVEMVLDNYQEKGVYFGRYTNETNEMRNPKPECVWTYCKKSDGEFLNAKTTNTMIIDLFLSRA